MRSTFGPAPLIIQQAIELGILCRPVYHGLKPGAQIRVGSGEGLEVSEDMFWLVYADHREVFHPTPHELALEWCLVTREIIRQEWCSEKVVPW